MDRCRHCHEVAPLHREECPSRLDLDTVARLYRRLAEERRNYLLQANLALHLARHGRRIDS
ncbi:MAG: hypothetical protein M0006_03175 [Magnetospirillum sp.]|nr:hypothetical protein [Magnetospirillum sp.]